MDIQPIRTPAEHTRALAQLTACLEGDPTPGTSAADQPEVLATLIEHYENTQFPVEWPSPIEAIRFRMDQLDLAQKDLVPPSGKSPTAPSLETRVTAESRRTSHRSRVIVVVMGRRVVVAARRR